MKKSKLDAPFSTELYTMGAMPYEGVYIGVLNTYHGETIQPIPDDKPWMDRVDNQLVKPLVFLGDTLVVNANAAGGSLTVEALDAAGKVIDGFGIADCTPITTDSVRHVSKWKDTPDFHLLLL